MTSTFSQLRCSIKAPSPLTYRINQENRSCSPRPMCAIIWESKAKRTVALPSAESSNNNKRFINNTRLGFT